jgi:hypothetical protein
MWGERPVQDVNKWKEAERRQSERASPGLGILLGCRLGVTLWLLT